MKLVVKRIELAQNRMFWVIRQPCDETLLSIKADLTSGKSKIC
jgi:hypothetical protein